MVHIAYSLFENLSVFYIIGTESFRPCSLKTKQTLHLDIRNIKTQQTTKQTYFDGQVEPHLHMTSDRFKLYGLYDKLSLNAPPTYSDGPVEPHPEVPGQFVVLEVATQKLEQHAHRQP